MEFNRSSARKLQIGLCAAMPIVLVAAACISRVGAQPPAGEELAGKKFKNIKVLQNLPADKLLPTMHEWSASLSVKCDFCHVVNADHTGFELDTKPTKRTARVMYAMLTDMNRREKPLGKRATCFLCHHGHQTPELHPSTEQTGK